MKKEQEKTSRNIVKVGFLNWKRTKKQNNQEMKREEPFRGNINNKKHFSLIDA